MPDCCSRAKHSESHQLLRTLSSKKPLEHGLLTPEKPKKRKQIPQSWERRMAEGTRICNANCMEKRICLAVPSQNLRTGSIPHRNYCTE
jgi:hypothetical protein